MTQYLACQGNIFENVIMYKICYNIYILQMELYPTPRSIMSFPQDLVFAKRIDPTLDNAEEIRREVLQDVLAGGFEDPETIANPDDHKEVTDQQFRMYNHPDQFSGFLLNGKLVAFTRSNYWYISDELPFASGMDAFTLRARKALHLSPMTGEWGISALVASDSLDDAMRHDALVGLLQYGLQRGQDARATAVNIVIHDHDPLLAIAPSLGFVPVGKKGEAAGAPGLLQQRYKAPVPR